MSDDKPVRVLRMWGVFGVAEGKLAASVLAPQPLLYFDEDAAAKVSAMCNEAWKAPTEVRPVLMLLDVDERAEFAIAVPKDEADTP